MNKIVILKASPRKNGNTNALANAFSQEAKKSGADIIEYEVANMKIGGCRGCYSCVSKKECVFKDDFNKISTDISNADGIVISSPVYWYTFPAQIKAVIDRLFSMYVAEKDFSGKKVALLSCCEEETMETFTGIKFAFEKTMSLLNADIVGEVLIPKVSDIGEIKQTDGESQASRLAEKFL